MSTCIHNPGITCANCPPTQTPHWHAGHNIAGYLPESDVSICATWDDALSALVSDLEHAWDEAGTRSNGDAQYLDAHTAMHAATAGTEFLTYTATHADSEHDIPTAWWITSCTESDCESDYTDNADGTDDMFRNDPGLRNAAHLFTAN